MAPDGDHSRRGSLDSVDLYAGGELSQAVLPNFCPRGTDNTEEGASVVDAVMSRGTEDEGEEHASTENRQMKRGVHLKTRKNGLHERGKLCRQESHGDPCKSNRGANASVSVPPDLPGTEKLRPFTLFVRHSRIAFAVAVFLGGKVPRTHLTTLAFSPFHPALDQERP